MNAPAGLIVAAALQWLAAAISLVTSLTLIVAGMSMSGSPVEAEVEATLVAQGIKHVSGHAVSTGVVLAGTVLLLVALARIVASWFLVQGRSWARMVITLLVLLSLLSGISYMFNDEILRGVLTIAIEVAILYLMFNGPSSRYIAEASAKRAEVTSD